ncbi:hypothetical protein [Maritimibacter fusiformis]|uniref:Tyr recombinase domain-containing protein n=1 Tax=Maritimibacter fusiformis TaxID=2603819 RepID=A0A5D0RRB4_9RHOB|nr:hypothetical protein [Maritimibacter fusiformis]TYB83104.1 hypothetical protein FVF75_02670 [Maritimibacter fusiformis]
MAKVNFTRDNLPALKPGKTLTDAGFGGYGEGTLQAKASKSGGVTVSVKFMLNGKQVRRTVRQDVGYWIVEENGTPAKLRGEAREVVQQARLESARPARGQVLSSEAGAKMRFVELAERYLEWRATNEPFRGASTVRAVRKAAERADAFFYAPVVDLEPSDGTQFLAHVVADAVAASKARAKAKGDGAVGGRVSGDNPGYQAAISTRGLLRPMLRDFALGILGLKVRVDLFDGWKAKTNEPKKGAMTKEERAKFFKALDEWQKPQSNRTGRRHQGSIETADMLRLAYMAGGRGGEWKEARWGQIKNLDGACEPGKPGTWPTWTFEPGERKQGTTHTQVLDPWAVAILRQVRERRLARWGAIRPGDYVFPSATARKPDERPRSSYGTAFNAVIELSGINEGKGYRDKLTPHRVLRASRITELLTEKGWTAKEVADHLGMTVDVIERVYLVEHEKLNHLTMKVAELTDPTAG